MKITSYFLGLLICLLAFNGCQQEQLYSEKGSFTVMLEDDLTDIITTKSTPTELGKPLTSQFQLEIRNINTEEIAYNGLCDKTYYEVNTGTYDLTATYGSNEELAFDAPYYKGELKSQKVEASGNSVTIPCSIANSLVSVKYTNENVFNTLFSSYGITVTCNDKSLIWSSEKAQQSVYFKAGSSVSFVFKGILKEGNKEVSFPITEGLPKTFAAKDHYILKLTYQAGQSSLSITTEYKSSSINETVPQSWLPAPQLESTDFSSTKVLSSVETEKKSAIIQMKIARPLQDMQIEFDFQDTQFTSLNKTYLLSELSNDEATALENAGIILPKIGDSAPVINLTELTEKLQTINGGTTTVNNVYIKAKANDRWSHDEASRGDHYNINITKPEFNINVYPGDLWTKEFSITPSITTGNEQKIISNLKYEYSIDEINWLPATDKNTVKSLSPNSTYNVRAIYRDIISGSINTKTYNQIAIPNSGLDDGWDTSYPKSKNPLYTPNGGWWSTLNPLTCHADGANAFYVSKSGTIPITEDGRNVAWLMTLGWGSGNTCSFGNKSGSVINNISAGALCIGTFDKESKSFSGIEASTRPTALSYTYKSASYSDDKYEVSILLENQTDGITTVIGSAIEQKNETTSNYNTKTLIINYDDTKKILPITHLKILFKSGINENNKDYLEDKFRKEGSGSFYSNYFIIGSQLWIDNISLIYDK